MRVLVIVAVFVSAAQSLYGQMETTAYFMSTLPQVVEANPAFVPKYNVAIGLPFSRFTSSYSNNGFTYNDLTRLENRKRVIDLTQLQAVLPEKTYITTAVQADLFRLGLKIGPRFYFSLHSTVRGYTQAMMPKDVITLLAGGTAAYVGQTANLSPTFYGMTFWENAVGLSFAPNDKLRVGARLKRVHGGQSVSTELSDISLSVADNYAMNVAADLHVRTSGIQDAEPVFANYMKNTGWVTDIGATYKLMPKLTIAASAVDLGYIRWRNNVYDYTMDKETASFTFSGMDVDDLINGDTGGFEDQLDSLQENFSVNEGPGSSFSMALPAKFYLSGSYDVTKSFSVGTVFFAEQFMGRTATGWTASINKNFGRVLGTAVTYTVSNRSYNNLGAGLTLNFGPIQFYAVGDNLLRVPVSLIKTGYVNQYVNSTKVFNARLGVNIVWGWKKQPVADQEDNSKSYNQKKSGKTKEIEEDNSKSFNAGKKSGGKTTTDKRKQPQAKKKKVPSHIRARQRAKR